MSAMKCSYALLIFVVVCSCQSIDEIRRCQNREPTPNPDGDYQRCRRNDSHLESTKSNHVYWFDLRVQICHECGTDESVLLPWHRVAEHFNANVSLLCKQMFKKEKVIRVALYFRLKSNNTISVAEITTIYNSVNPNSSYVKPVSYHKENHTKKCGENARFSTIYNNTKCRCDVGYRGNPLIKCSSYCQGRKVCGLSFPDTAVDDVAVVRKRCFNETKFFHASIKCGEIYKGTDFMFPSLTVVPCGETPISAINMASNSNISEQEFSKFTGYLQAVTVNSSSLNKNEVKKIVNFINSTAQRSRNQNLTISATTSLQSIALIVSQLAEGYWNKTANPGGSNRSQNSFRLRYEVAENFPRICLESTFDEGKNPDFEIQSPTFAVKRYDVSLKKSTNIEYAPTIQTRNGTESTPVSLFIPASVIQKSAKTFSKNSSITSQRATYIYYKDDTFFPSDKIVYDIFSVNIGLDESLTSSFSEPISIKHHNVPQASKVPVKGNKLLVEINRHICVFWDFTRSDWSSKGCRLNKSASSPECLCNHLTNFALLVKSETVRADSILTTVSVIGCSLSIIGLLFTIALFTYKKDLRKFRPGKILLHLCCALAVAYLIFVSGVSNAVGNSAGCTLVAVLLHYFFLVTMCWMAVYSFEMYNSLVKVFPGYQKDFLIRASIISYLFPAIIVALSAGIPTGKKNQVVQNNDENFESDDMTKSSISSYRSNIHCWIKGNSLYFGFLLPVGLMVIYNFVVFCLVTRKLRKQNKHLTHLRRSTIDSLIIAVTMTCMMGLTWIFGFLLLLARDETSYAVLSWIFAITNTLQGFGIFLTMSVRREDIRNIWWTPIKNALNLGDKQSSKDLSYPSTSILKSFSTSKNEARFSVYSQTPLTES